MSQKRLPVVVQVAFGLVMLAVVAAALVSIAVIVYAVVRLVTG